MQCDPSKEFVCAIFTEKNDLQRRALAMTSQDLTTVSAELYLLDFIYLLD